MRKPRGPRARDSFIPLGAGHRVRAELAPTGARRGPPPRTTAVGTAERPDGPQTLILDGFPTIYQVAALGPNTSTMNRYGLGRIRRDIQGRAKIEADRQHIRPVPPPVVVTLRYVFSDSRHRDVDNFTIIAKPVIDGLVKAGILAGDNAARLRQRVEFVKEPGARRLEVVLTPVQEGM
jgi:hypothetical protein